MWLKLLPGALKLVPREVWYVLALAALWGGGRMYHEHRVSQYGSERFMAGYSKAVEDGRQLKEQAELIGNQISKKLKDQNDETLRAIDRLGDTIRLRGPGRAICTGPTQPATPSGGDGKTSRPAVPPLDSVPNREGQLLIGLPFDDAISFAELCDANRAETLTWRAWHKQVKDKWSSPQN